MAAERAELPLRLADGLEDDLGTAGLEPVYRDIEQPLIPILAAIELAGIKVDVPALAVLGRSMQTELEALSRGIFEHAGGDFNINSPKQLGEVLFEKLNLQSTKKTGKTRVVSTAREVLEELALSTSCRRLVLSWREIHEAEGHLRRRAAGPRRRAHRPRAHDVQSSRGRHGPAEQQRPEPSEHSDSHAARPRDSGRLHRRTRLCADLGRLLADRTAGARASVGRRSAHDAFRQGVDIHDRTAERVFGGVDGPLKLERHELRRRAKIINYALLYGKTAFTLAKDIGVPQQAAQAFIDAYFAGFPAVRTFIDRTLAEARDTGIVRTLTGRRRLVPELTSKNGQVRAAAERETVNMPIQGTAADILKRAMIDVHAALLTRNAGRSAPARMILTVHDELLFEAREDEAPEVAALVQNVMEGAFPLSVPLTVDVGVGKNWKDAKP